MLMIDEIHNSQLRRQVVLLVVVVVVVVVVEGKQWKCGSGGGGLGKL